VPDGVFSVPSPTNEPVRTYAPGSAEQVSLAACATAMSEERVEAPMVIGAEHVTSGQTFSVAAPHRHELVLADVHAADAGHVMRAIDAARQAATDWAATPWAERAAIFLRAADLIAGPWRDTINAATILGQSKSVHQAEIDAACELIDFLRFNCAYAERLYEEQPLSVPGVWNRVDYRPLEGFVLAVTPFNFTAIAGNLPTAPAIMGNVVVWKPSEKAALSAHYVMAALRAAGLPDGVINLVHGSGALVSDVAFDQPDFAGLHFTGSTTVLRDLWRRAGERIDTYRGYPRIVGESGGKDFIVAHPSADCDSLVVALGRGAFEYQGQKCSAVSRAYVPRSRWPEVRDGVADLARTVPVGDPADFRTFMGAVIDEAAFRKHERAIAEAREQGVEVLAGGATDAATGWFVDPTVLVTGDPKSETMTTELFGPIVTIYVYDDAHWSETLSLVDTTSPYALTGAVFAGDRAAVDEAKHVLRNAAGNFYVNDKPTGSIVGQQPFGGARGSGTNDKAGSLWNLIRWVSPRSLKETFVPPTTWDYPHMRDA
jgi:1-pyrroline-5-carboxylate dehydrogenase